MADKVTIVIAEKVELFGKGREIFSHLRRLGMILAGTPVDIDPTPLNLDYKGEAGMYYACSTEFKGRTVEGYVQKAAVQAELDGGV